MKGKECDQTTDRDITHLKVPEITNSGEVIIDLKPGGVHVVQFSSVKYNRVIK